MASDIPVPSDESGKPCFAHLLERSAPFEELLSPATAIRGTGPSPAVHPRGTLGSTCARAAGASPPTCRRRPTNGMSVAIRLPADGIDLDLHDLRLLAEERRVRIVGADPQQRVAAVHHLLRRTGTEQAEPAAGERMVGDTTALPGSSFTIGAANASATASPRRLRQPTGPRSGVVQNSAARRTSRSAGVTRGAKHMGSVCGVRAVPRPPSNGFSSGSAS
jgi:hypothetical protein